MAGEKDALLAELVGDGEDVGSEFRERVGCRATRFAAFVVAALVRDDEAEACGGERVDLVVPGIPEFGEAMEQDDYGPIGRAGGDSVKLDRAVVKGRVFERGWHGAELTLNYGGTYKAQEGGASPALQSI